ncbi:hypothetical protein VNO80_14145 [Phaseolus coccineus]|uniref:poly(ADP-ribose) glycohydrolase n=1 Tax=Phaseolus coccineus TaxID=3886 RepID=A0AAN9R5Q5_PHACN
MFSVSLCAKFEERVVAATLASSPFLISGISSGRVNQTEIKSIRKHYTNNSDTSRIQKKMEKSEELRSILPYLPLQMRSSSLFWPSQAAETLRKLGGGRVHSGDLLFQEISHLRNALSLSSKPLSPSTSLGYAHFFDKVMSGEQSRKWFQEVVPVLANLLLRLPSLLETHYQNPHNAIFTTTALRLLDSQQPGIIFLSQELIAALLCCSFFCVFPVKGRHVKHLPMINFDKLFSYPSGVKMLWHLIYLRRVLVSESACGSEKETLHENYSQKQENKIWCIIHYFQRISAKMPKGIVSFERKVLHLKNDSTQISCPDANFWSTSSVPLCRFEVHSSGLIEDQSSEVVEVDFADKSFGGRALCWGCVQEEIRFMINPELIAGMLFLPAMADNEAIEVVGVERFSSYKGYSSSFRFSGDYVDEREVDTLGRRKTTVVAIDALRRAGTRQYRANFLLRSVNIGLCGYCFMDAIPHEINKAFCGFLFQCKYQLYQKKLQENGCSFALFEAATSTSMETSEGKFSNHETTNSQNDYLRMDQGNNIGVATGNWGCGVFKGDPEVKTIIQWLAVSQTRRPFIEYYTFGLKALQSLDEVAHSILSERWTVGDLWNKLVEYSTSRSKGETKVGFFQWLLPSIYGHGNVLQPKRRQPKSMIETSMSRPKRQRQSTKPNDCSLKAKGKGKGNYEYGNFDAVYGNFDAFHSVPLLPPQGFLHSNPLQGFMSYHRSLKRKAFPSSSLTLQQSGVASSLTLQQSGAASSLTPQQNNIRRTVKLHRRS